MSNRSSRIFLLVAAALAIATDGCVIATDLVNPSLLTGLGFDPQTVIPPQGRLVVAFQNQTAFPVFFGAAFSRREAIDVNKFEVLQADDVGPDETRSMVLDCPIAVFVPAVAAVVANQAAVVVTYTGSELDVNRDYVCGDVIVVRVVQVGPGTAEGDFQFQVELLPGR
ncbi:MAG: hypothetical protein HZB38_04385 [Planctomycetes bacterium]|nr:hypothetical protein [Planctomycetota bacterium]